MNFQNREKKQVGASKRSSQALSQKEKNTMLRDYERLYGLRPPRGRRKAKKRI